MELKKLIECPWGSTWIDELGLVRMIDVDNDGIHEQLYFGLEASDAHRDLGRAYCCPNLTSPVGLLDAMKRRSGGLKEWCEFFGVPLTEKGEWARESELLQWKIHGLGLVQMLTSGDKEELIWAPAIKNFLYKDDGAIDEEIFNTVCVWAKKYESELMFIDDEFALEGYHFKLNRAGKFVKLAEPWSYQHEEE